MPTVVDYDPFAATAPKGKVVDHDPFAEEDKPGAVRRAGQWAIDNIPGAGLVQQLGVGTANAVTTAIAGLRSLGYADLGIEKMAEVAAQTRDKLHIDPGHSNDPILKGIGWVANNTVGRAAEPLDKAVANAGPGVSTFVPAVADFVDNAGYVLGAGAAAKQIAGTTQAAKAAVGAENSTVKPGTAEAARAAGFKLRPSDVAKESLTPMGRVAGTAERVGGSQFLRQEYSVANQSTVQGLAKKALGIEAPAVKFDPELLTKNRAPSLAVYEKVKKLPDNPHGTTFMDEINKISDSGATPAVKETIASWKKEFGRNASSADLVEWMKSQRADATRRFVSEDADAVRLGKVNREIAKAAERELERRAVDQPGLLDEFRAAREHLAKSYTVEETLVGGKVDAHKLKLLERNNPGTLSNELKIIADVAENFPEAVRHPSTFQNAPGGNPVQGTLFGTIKHNTVGALGRKTANADWVQNKFGSVAADKGAQGPLSMYFRDRKPGAPVSPDPVPNLAAYPNGSGGGPSGVKAGSSGGLIPTEPPNLAMLRSGAANRSTPGAAAPTSLFGTPVAPEAPNLAAYPQGVGSGARTTAGAQAPSGLMPIEVMRDSMGMPIETLEQARARIFAELLKGNK